MYLTSGCLILQVQRADRQYGQPLPLKARPTTASIEGMRQLWGLWCAQMQLVHLVAVEAFDAALEVAAEAYPDVRPRELQGAFPPIKPDTWPEVCYQPGSCHTHAVF